MSVMAEFERITSDPAILNGQPCIRGLPLTVQRVLEALANYSDRDKLRAEYPELEEEDIRQALEYAAANLVDKKIIKYNRLFRWRVIPATLLYTYGVCGVFAGVMIPVEMICLLLWAFYVDRHPKPIYTEKSLIFLIPVIACGSMAFGVTALYAGRLFWKGVWRRGIVMTLITAVIYACCLSLFLLE
jgi:uncharacterized protein (DUF433 family)